MIKKIKDNIYQLSFENFGSCVYVLKIKNKIILIDSSSKNAREEFLKDLKELNISPKKVDVLILTHNHYDHIQNNELFPNSKIYFPEKLNENSIIEEIPEMKIIETSGHTPESKCYLYKNVLFSGDTLFDKGFVGRTDLPGGNAKELENSLDKISKIKYEILCPGHLV